MSTAVLEPTAEATSQSVSAVAGVQARSASRLLYVDNIRVLLTIIVVIFHVMIIYAGTGSWYYTEGRQDFVTSAAGAWFLTVNQAYFMGLFLLISAYFVPGAYDRKGAGRFLKDRLIRLGIPLALYSWVLRPLLVYLDPMVTPAPHPPLVVFLRRYFASSAIVGDGPLWFIETLLIFSALYVFWRLLVRPRTGQPAASDFPGNGAIAVFALLLGVAGFLVRLWHPVGWNFKLLNLQFPFFAQYIALFVIGLVAYRRNWLAGLPDKVGRLWLGTAGGFVLLFWPLVLGGGAIENGLDAFKGGWHWQAAGYAVWESFLCVGMCIGLVYAFRRWGNRQGRLAGVLSRNAYAAYLIHGVVITAIAYALRDVAIYPLLKWAVVSLVAVPSCFALSSLICRLPYADRVL